MIKNKKILIIFLGIIIFGLMIFSNKVFAASASITSSKTVTQGSSVTVTGSVNAGAWNVTLSGNGQSKGLVGQTSTASNSSASTSITFKASKVGTYTFSLTGDITDFNTDKTTNVSKGCTITVKAKTATSTKPSPSTSTSSKPKTSPKPSTEPKKDTNCNLTNLGIKPHDFSGFSPSKTSYSVSVPNDTKSVQIYATKASSSATISGTGTKKLKEGTNRFSIVVRNNGASKTYSISINRLLAEDTEDIPPNVVEEEEKEPEEVKGGLTSLDIPNYELDKIFNPSVFDYTVIVDKELTMEDLDEIKASMIYKTSDEKLKAEATSNISEDEKRTITIVVKNDKNEVARYIITFELKEPDEVQENLAGIFTPVSQNSGNDGGGNVATENKSNFKLYLAIGGFITILLIAVALAVISYIQTKRLQECGYYDNEDGDSEFPKMTQYGDDVENDSKKNSKNREEELLDPSQEFGEITTEIISKSQKLNGYRNLRGQRKAGGGGRHF